MNDKNKVSAAVSIALATAYVYGSPNVLEGEVYVDNGGGSSDIKEEVETESK